MSDKPLIEEAPSSELDDAVLQSRRDFLIGLGRWSKIVIGAAVFGGLAARMSDAAAGAWVNRRGGWVNARSGGAGWVNAASGGGGAWVNRRGGSGGGAWANRRGGGGAWANRRY
jgi:hypothetical protein